MFCLSSTRYRQTPILKNNSPPHAVAIYRSPHCRDGYRQTKAFLDCCTLQWFKILALFVERISKNASLCLQARAWLHKIAWIAAKLIHYNKKSKILIIFLTKKQKNNDLHFRLAEKEKRHYKLLFFVDNVSKRVETVPGVIVLLHLKVVVEGLVNSFCIWVH